MKTLIAFLLLTQICFAGEVLYPTSENPKGIVIQFDDRFSGKDYTTVNFIDIPDNIIVYASCFSKEIPDSKIFPDTMKGITFVNCNLDNVYIPTGNTVMGGSKRKFKAQIDGEDWLVNNDLKPLEPLDKEGFIRDGKSIDPKDIKSK